jgi:group I intron endonuclease
MFGKTHSEKTKDLMRNKKVKYPNGVGIYDLDNNLLKSFDYASDLAIYLNVSKVTVSKYINKGLVFIGKYSLKVNPFNE